MYMSPYQSISMTSLSMFYMAHHPNNARKSYIKIAPLPVKCNQHDVKEMLYVDDATDIHRLCKVVAIKIVEGKAEAVLEVPGWLVKKMLEELIKKEKQRYKLGKGRLRIEAH